MIEESIIRRVEGSQSVVEQILKTPTTLVAPGSYGYAFPTHIAEKWTIFIVKPLDRNEGTGYNRIMLGRVAWLNLSKYFSIIFAVRLAKTRKFMSAGLMVILGVASLVVMLKQLFASV